MTPESERLRVARKAASYGKARDAARAMGIPEQTYAGHENGSRDFPHVAKRYAKFFKVSLEWLMTGRGDMRQGQAVGGLERIAIDIDGLVGAGAAVEQIGDSAASTAPDEHSLPPPERIGGYVVVGESQWPRFQAGEVILYDRDPVKAGECIGRYAIVQTVDGRRLVKIVKRRTGPNRWTLASHNAPDEEDVELIGAWRYLGVLAIDGGRAR